MSAATTTPDAPTAAGQMRLLLIDGHAMAFRAFFALPPDSFTDGRGQSTNAVYGFTRMIYNVVQSERPTHVAVAFDLPGGTFRDRIYDQYKGGREETPPQFKGQIALIQQVLDALGVAWLTVEDFEADDIIATLATRAEAAGARGTLIVSSDRDAIQLVSDAVTLLQPVKGVTELRRMDPAAVEEKYQVVPSLYPDLAALVGESADNLPGVPGVGPKTAAKWIGQYGSLEGILANAEKISGKAGQSLRDNVEAVERNRRMNAAVRDLELPADDTFRLGRGDVARTMAVFDDLAFGDTIRRDLPAALLPDGESVDAATGGPGADVREVELPEHVVAEEAEDLMALASAPYVAVVDADDVRGGPMLGLATPEHRVSVRLEELGSEATTALEAIIASDGTSVLTSDAKGLRRRLAERGIRLSENARDLAIEAFVLRPGARSYDPEALVASLTEHRFPPAPRRPAPATLKKESPETRAAAITAAGERLSTAASHLIEAAAVLASQLDAEPWARSIVDDLERPVATVLEGMERAGIAASRERLEVLAADLRAEVERAQSSAEAVLGESVNLSSPKQLQTVLFETLGLPTTRRIASGYTTDAESLVQLSMQAEEGSRGAEFLAQLLRYREVSKLEGYVTGLLGAIEDDGRIRTTYVQTAAATGRLASTDPNLQNIPVRTEEGRRLRSVFVHGEGFETLLTADYSQIEMRIMAHLSEDAGLIEAFRSGEDLHDFVASRVFGVDPDDVDPAMRAKTKAVSYGLAYGLSAFGLSRQLRIPQAEAKALRDGYFERFGGVRDYLRSSVEEARERGYTETILGRRRYLPDLTSDNRQRRENAERVALNSPIQGSAADLMKLAMLRVADGIEKAGLRSRVLLQVHDELVVEVAVGELDRVRDIVVTGMGGAQELSVPLEVGVGVGSDWLAASH